MKPKISEKSEGVIPNGDAKCSWSRLKLEILTNISLYLRNDLRQEYSYNGRLIGMFSVL